jgi:hypothetical protein
MAFVSAGARVRSVPVRSATGILASGARQRREHGRAERNDPVRGRDGAGNPAFSNLGAADIMALNTRITAAEAGQVSSSGRVDTLFDLSATDRRDPAGYRRRRRHGERADGLGSRADQLRRERRHLPRRIRDRRVDHASDSAARSRSRLERLLLRRQQEQCRPVGLAGEF